MIQFLNVSKQYDDKLFSLEDLSFEIQEGEFVFLVGPSGSGKTSIIKLLIREENPTKGKIFFEDEDITRFNRNKVYQLRRRIGVIFQDFKLINELNAYENVAFAMEAAGKPDKEIKDNVPYLLDIVGLAHRAKSFPYQLSGGEKQRVAIARAMANNPKLLIADEPTGNLDPDTAWDIAQILYKINNWGTTVLMSTHGSDIVNSMHKRVIRLQDGKMVRDDFKGSYDEVDEFSLRIINNNEKSSAPETTTETSAVKAPEEKEEKKDIIITTDQKSKTQNKSNRKISFSTRKTRIKPAIIEAETELPEEQADEAQVVEKLEPDLILEQETEKTLLSELTMSDSLREKLDAADLTNLEEVIAKGATDIENEAGLTAKELKELAKIIKTNLESK